MRFQSPGEVCLKGAPVVHERCGSCVSDARGGSSEGLQQEHVGAEFRGAGQTSEFTLDCLGQRRACLGECLSVKEAVVTWQSEN